MTAKQCLRHEWLRGAPTQASAHLRKYLSKSREVLLERVVSRENLRRAALLGQAANGLSQQLQQQQQLENQWGGSEICLNRGFNGSRGSLASSIDDYESGGQDTSSSRTSLADSICSSKSSLAMSQSCLLNKEQTEGLLSQAQDRKSLRASMAQGLNRVSVLSKLRGLNQSRSQACIPLLNNSCSDRHHQASPTLSNSYYFDGSREKLYGLKSLSKSQAMLDIYRSLESLQRHKRDLLKQKERSKTEDVLPFSRHLTHGSSSGSLGSGSSRSAAVMRDFDDHRSVSQEKEIQHTGHVKEVIEPEVNVKTTELVQKEQQEDEQKQQSMDCDSVDDGNDRPRNNEPGHDTKSTGPSSLTVSEANLDSLQSMESDTLTDDSEETNASRGLTNKQSATGSECHGRETDSEIEEPKFTVAQLVSAFNKHQEVAQRSSLEAIMTEKRVADDSTNFPIGPKALRLFIPDIDISEKKPLVRRKTSYKPRKNWEELRKQNEKNEGLLSKDFFNDSGNEEDEEMNNEDEETKANEEAEISIDASIDDKYKQCVEVAKVEEEEKKAEQTPPLSPSSMDSGVNLRDILQKTDAFESAPKENLEKLRERTSLTKNILHDSTNNSLASKISVFASDKKSQKDSTSRQSRLHSTAKEKLCTGSYVRAMEKFSGKANLEKQVPRSRRTSATSQQH